MQPEKDICPYCGHERKWDLWVCAHWDLRLNGNCEECKKPYSVQRGIAIKWPEKIRKSKAKQ